MHRSATMRQAFHHELDDLLSGLAEMVTMVHDTMARATDALLDLDGSLAESVITGEDAIDDLCQAADDHALSMLARQQPVATDLRTLAATLRISNDVERMARLARHVAEMVRFNHPRSVIPADLQPTIRQMSETAQRIVAGAAQAIGTRNAKTAVDLDRADDEIDRIHDALYQQLLSGTWPHGTDVAVRIALVARYFERYADHAVSVARQVAFIAGINGWGKRPSVLPRT
jgi:phosphate transport system protein